MTQLSTLQCPSCATEHAQPMPDDRCVYFWECPNCNQLIKPKEGDCCVFCSYGKEPCPPKMNKSCC